MTKFEIVSRTGDEVPSSPLRAEPPTRPPLRLGAVQLPWHPDPLEHRAAIADGVAQAAALGAQVVCLQELTLSPYFCVRADVEGALATFGEDLAGGPTRTLASELARRHGVCVHASLYERTAEGRGFNTAICVDADGALVAHTRKVHIPQFAYYHEDRYFEPAGEDPAVVEVAGARFAFPTCWDQWFPELARGLSLAGAEVIVYPTAIGSEPDFPGVDSQPWWRQTIVANGLTSATFMVAINRIGEEPPLGFYGSSFISDPYGRVLVEAPRDRPCVLVADLDLDQRRDFLGFGLLATRRPERYGRLVAPLDPVRSGV